MESNKDEALRCIELAIEFHKEKKIAQALKFVNKSIALYPTPEATALLQRLQRENSNTQHNDNNRSTPSHSSTNQHTTTTTHTNTPSPSTQKPFTQEQQDAVVRVKKCSKDYYAVLEVARDATEGVIKKQYRKVALLLHPDKNSAPGAEEAFKVVSQAFACLSDPDKKKRYDMYGHDSVSSASSGGGGGFRRQGYEHEMTPEELFEMMFGLRPSSGGFRTYTYQSGMGGNRTRHRSGGGQAHSNAGEAGFSLIQLMPLLLLLFSILLMSALNSGSDEPQFRFTKMHPYSIERVTSTRHVTYYVNSDMEEKIVQNSVNLVDLENTIERSWRSELEKKCMFQRKQKQKMEHAANYYKDGQHSYMKEKAHAFKMDACEALYAY